MEVDDVASTSLVAQTARRRKDPKEEIGGDLRSFREASGMTYSERVQFATRRRPCPGGGHDDVKPMIWS